MKMRKAIRRTSTLLIVLGAAISAAGADWITDPATKCAIWNPKPVPHETISWSGSVRDGQAEGLGIAVWSVRGRETERAEGTWRGGKLHGYAVWTHANGSGYEGQWEEGRKHGFGVYTWPNGASFTGSYKRDTRADGRAFSTDGKPLTLISSEPDHKAMYAAQDAAIQARKSATKSRIQCGTQKLAKSTSNKKPAKKRRAKKSNEPQAADK
jgi:hypothetical protein